MKPVRTLALSAAAVALTLAAAPPPAAAAESPPAAQAAEAHFAAERWGEAAAAYEAVVAAAPANGEAWSRLGISRFHLGLYAEALAAFAEAKAAGYGSVLQFALTARAHEGLGQREQAMAVLDELVGLGLSPGELRSNPVFAPFREDAGFPALVAKAEATAFPCKAEPESAQFDFWIGEWGVYVQGQRRGSSRIEALPGGCVIVESYENPGGFAGKSLNFYDPELGEWRQIWADNGGNVIFYQGGPRDGGMAFEGEGWGRRSPKGLSRMIFTPNDDGSVRQLIERSDDGGETWSVYFDGRYVREGQD